MAIVKNHVHQLTFLSSRFPFCWPCHEETLRGIYWWGDKCVPPRKSVKTSRGDWGERALDATPPRPASSSVAEENTSDISGKNSTCGGKVSKMNLKKWEQIQ